MTSKLNPLLTNKEYFKSLPHESKSQLCYVSNHCLMTQNHIKFCLYESKSYQIIALRIKTVLKWSSHAESFRYEGIINLKQLRLG